MIGAAPAYARNNHLALIALVVALVGVPAAWAALAANSVGPRQIKPNAVRSSEIDGNAVRSAEVRNGSLLAEDIAAGELSAGVPGPSPVEVVGPISAADGAGPATLASVSYSEDGPRRLLLTGGFNAACNPCSAEVTPAWRLVLQGSVAAVVRKLSPMTDPDAIGTSVSEVIVTPTVCGPCTYDLTITVPDVAGSTSVDSTVIRLAIVDLGPVS